MSDAGLTSSLLLGVLLGCLGSAVVYWIIQPRVRQRRNEVGKSMGGSMRTGDRAPGRARGARGGVSMRALRRVLGTPELITGALMVMAFAIVAVAAPVIAPPSDGDEPYLIPADGFDLAPKPPGDGHLLGTMERGRDIAYGLIWGARVAFQVGLTITLGRFVLGLLLGLASGYTGGVTDAIIMRATDAFLAFPVVAAVLVMVAFFGGGWVSILRGGADRVILLTLILFGWMPYARMVRGNVLVEREKEYVMAAISVGASHRRIVFRHVLPNATRGLFVLVASDIGAMVVLVAVFSYLGLSGGEALADWGQMLNLARNWVVGARSEAFKYWYTYIPPSAAIVLFSAGWNLIGDGLRVALDPRWRGSRAARRTRIGRGPA